ncbi:MAG TPA: CopD family protein [Steroidobacteraceae bacterium]|nr:CopD family protein [Steroidobacteraceae bacterium]
MTDLAWALLRIAAFVLVLQAAGLAAFRLTLARRLPVSGATFGASARRTAVAALATVVAQCLIEPAHLGGELSALLDPALARLALSTSGVGLLTRLAGAACLALGARTEGAPSRPVTIAGIALADLSFVWSGHVAESRAWPLLSALLLCHVSIVSWWLGALLPLHRAVRLEAPAQMAMALRAFSRVAVWLVPVIALAGSAMAAALLADFAALWRPYGLLLLAKAALFAALMGLAAVNRLVLVPRIAAADITATGALRATVLAEYLLIVAALAATALMTGLYSPS